MNKKRIGQRKRRTQCRRFPALYGVWGRIGQRKSYNKNFSSIDTCLETYLSYIMKHQLQCHFQAGELRKEAKNGRRFVSSVPVLLICLTHSHHFLQPGYWTPTAVASSFG